MSQEIIFDGRAFISAQDAGREIGMTGDHIARLAKAGRIPARRLGNIWFVDQDAARLLTQLRDQRSAPRKTAQRGVTRTEPHSMLG